MANGLKTIAIAVLAAILAPCLTASAEQDRPVLKVSTVALPPLVTVEPNSDHVSGLAVEAVRHMALSCGVDVEFIAAPSWSRAFTMAREGTADALIPTNHSADRAAFFDFHPTALLDLGPAIMVHASSTIRAYDGLEQLRGKRIAVQQNILLEPAFDAFIRSGNVELTVRGNATALVEELLTGNVDFIADSKTVLEHFLGETGVLKRVRVLEPSLGTAPQYLALSKKRSAPFASGTALNACLMNAKP